MAKVIIMCGNIGSGKSTLTTKYVKEGYVVVGRDSLRYGIGNGQYIFNLKYEKIISMTEIFILEQFLSLGVNIVIDECNVSKELRWRLIHIIKYYVDYKIIIVKLKRLTMEESVKRRCSNNHGDTPKEVWEQVWDIFDKMYDEPTLNEDVDSILTIGE